MLNRALNGEAESWCELRPTWFLMDIELTQNVNHRYLPVMITRLMISLRKAARSQGLPWSMAESTVSRGPGHESYGMQFAPNYGESGRWEDNTVLSGIPLGGRE